MPVILVTQEAEIRMLSCQNHPGKTVRETLSRKKPIAKKKGVRAGGVAQGASPEFKAQCCKKKKKKVFHSFKRWTRRF
jgi:hypothetical protein